MVAGQLYPNLPGVLASVQDGGLRITKPTVAQKVTIIGVTDKTVVAINDPYPLVRAEDVNNFDLVSGAPSEITRAVEEASNGGADNIEVVVTSNTPAISAALRYDALDATYDLLLHTQMDIVCPAGIFLDTDTLDVAKNFGYQLADFAFHSTVNNNTVVGVIGTAPILGNETGIPSLAQLSAHVTALAAFDTSGIQGRDITIYDGVTDAGGDGVPDNYAFIGTDDRAIPVGTPPASAGNVLHDDRGNFIDIGAYINVFAGDYIFANETARRLYPTLGYYRGTAGPTYAGLIAGLPSWRGTTNLVLPSARPARNYSLSQANTLIGARYACAMDKPGGFKVVKGVTGAYRINDYYRSDFTLLSTVKIVHSAINIVRQVCEPFIGLPLNEVNANSMDAAIDSGLAILQDTGALNGYDFSLTSSPAARVLGNLTVDIKLDVAIEINQVTVKVALTPPAALEV